MQRASYNIRYITTKINESNTQRVSSCYGKQNRLILEEMQEDTTDLVELSLVVYCCYMIKMVLEF